VSFSNFLMGDVHFRKNNLEDAASFYSIFLTSTQTKDYTGIASFRLALCYEITGDRQKAIEYFTASGKGNKDLDDDIFAKRKGLIYQNRSVSKNEIELIKSSNLVENGKYAAAVDTLNNLIPLLKKEELIAEAKMLLTDAYYFMDNTEASLKIGKEALTFEGKENNWIKPFTMYYLARTHLKKGEIAEAKYYVDEAGDFSGYDYQNKLKNLLVSLIKDKE
ncbi:MAG: tetratricopeptide repeat protein, partial [Ignavibacteriaceae bacterium]|nr:tetratricopeptide repeat protein [Ignavibacteriaceae bacterium]